MNYSIPRRSRRKEALTPSKTQPHSGAPAPLTSFLPTHATRLCRTLSFLAPVLILFCSCKPKKTVELLQPSQALGIVLAEEAERVAGTKKQIAIIEPDASWGPTSLTEEVFKAAVAKEGYTVIIVKSANLGDPMRSGVVGLKAADFFEALQKAAGAGVIVSFVGVPVLNAEDDARVDPNHPPILAVATASLGEVPGVPADRARLAHLLDAKIIDAVVVDGASETPASPAAKSDSTHDLFYHNFIILHRPN